MTPSRGFGIFVFISKTIYFFRSGNSGGSIENEDLKSRDTRHSQSVYVHVEIHCVEINEMFLQIIGSREVRNLIWTVMHRHPDKHIS